MSKKGKIIVIEGTDCSGKNTQSKLLCEKLNSLNIKTVALSFPMYDTPTGKIVGGPYLGKKHICDGWFQEGANNVPAKVASLYFAADRLYNKDQITKYIDDGINVILDRYTTSNMGHQAGKLHTKEERLKMFKWLENLEYNVLELPKPDIKVFLYMPYIYTKKLQDNREELDEHELSKDNIINAEKAYLELALYDNFIKIDCVKDDMIRNVDEINEELINEVLKYIN